MHPITANNESTEEPTTTTTL